MSRTFNIHRKYYDDCVIYKKSTFTLEPGVTILVGCNGYGKSTMIREIEGQLDKENVRYVSYDNEHDGGSHSMRKAGFYGQTNLLATLFMSSEGERINTNLGGFASEIGKYCSCRENEKQKELWILLDSVDSGLSIDNIIDLKQDLFKTILGDKRNEGKEVYIVCAANSYEMAADERCYDVYSQQYINFENYDKYKKFILNCKKRKDKRTK